MFEKYFISLIFNITNCKFGNLENWVGYIDGYLDFIDGYIGFIDGCIGFIDGYIGHINGYIDLSFVFWNFTPGGDLADLLNSRFSSEYDQRSADVD